MRKLLLIIGFLITITFKGYSQCTYTGTPLTQVGTTNTFCVDNLNTITTGTVNAGQYVVVDVIKGFDYTFSVGNVFSGGRNENLTILNASTNANVSPAVTASSASGATLNWIATMTGQIKLLLSHSSCTNDNRTGGALTLTLNNVGNTQDSQTTYATDQWIGHVYNWTGTSPPGGTSPATPTASYPFTTANYVGYYPIATETLAEGFGGDLSCFPVYSNGAIRTNMYSETFAVRYRMRSTKVGCYEAAFSGDDGVRVYVDGVKVFDEWKEQSPTNYDNVLLYLNGNSDIIFDYYENAVNNVANFSLTPFDSGSNTATAPTPANVCSGVAPGAIDGSAYTYNGATVNPSITFQWQLSTDNVTFSNISGATSEDYTPVAITTTTGNVIRYYRRIVTASAATASGCSYTSNSVAIVTSQGIAAVPGTITGTATQCSALTGQTYSVVAVANATSYTWTVPIGWTITSGSGTTTITVTTGVSGQNGNISVASTNGCGSSALRTLAVTVISSVAGTVSANQTICSGVSPANITLTGSTGSIQWQSSTDNVTFNNIAGATATPLTAAQMGALTATTYYRAVVTNSACASATSTAVTVTVNPTSLAGTVSANQSICTSTQPANITLTGNTGTIQWQSSTDNVTFNNIAGATASPLTSAQMGTLTATRYYRAVLTSGVCSAINSAVVTVTVSPTSVAGTVSANQTICSSATPANITLTGSTGSIQWQSSTDNVTFNNIAGATATPLTGATIGALTATTYFKAVVTSGGCASATSGTVTVTVNPTSVAGTVSANQSICTSTQPANITLTGNTGTIQWQSSTDNVTFNNIAGATASPLTSAQMGTLTATRYYRAVVTSGVCSAINSTAVTVTVSPTSVAGTVSANQTICSGASPGNITLTGNTGSIQWQSSTNNVTFNNIAGATATPLTGATIGALTTTTYFKAVVTSGGCASATSGTLTVTVNPTSVAGTVSANQSICTSTQPANITLTGNTGTIQWQSSTDNVTFNNIIGATATPLTAAQMGALTATTYYRAVVTSGVCSAINSTAVTVTVNPTSVAGTVSSNQSICTSTQPANITLTGNTGTIQWQSSTDNVTFNNIAGATATPLTSAQMGTLTATRYYRAVVTSGVCSSINSTAVTVTVSPTSVAGTVSANQTICSAATPANITLTGNTGSIQWQSSTDNVTFNNIVGATASPLTSAQMGTLTATAYYRAVVTNSTCTSATSGSVTVTVNPTSVAGTVSSNQSICTSTQPANITLTGNTGTIQWQSSTDNVTFNNISGATASPLTSAQMGTLTATRYYRAVVTSGVCSAINSTAVTVTVSPTSVAGTVSANQTICSGATPANITLTGNTGTIQWQSSTDNVTFNNIAGATATPLTGVTIGALTATTYFKAFVTSGGCASATSGTVTVTVNPTSVAGTVSSNQSICTSTQPANITLTGNTGTIQWQSSTDNVTFNNIAGATASPLTSAQMGTLTATRYYRAVVTSGVCSAINSTTVTVTVSPTSVAGTVSANQTICSGATPANITLTGNTGTIQWQSSTDNVTFNNIAGATATPLTGATIGALTATTYFKAVVTSGGCASATSGTVTVTVNPTSVAGTVSANQSICTSTQPANITLTGNTGTIQWQSSTDNVTFNNIAGATATPLTSAQMGTLTATRYYRAIVTSGVCSAATSTTVTVTVSPTSVAGTVSANQAICSSAIPANITLTGSSGSIQWQSSTDNVTFNNIAGATATPLTGAIIGALTATTYFKAVVTSGGCTSVTSGTVTVTVNPTSVAGTVSANQSICTGSSPSNITLTGNTGTIQWQSSTDNVTFNNIAGATATPLTSAQMGTLTATRYYRAIVKSGVCSAATSTTVTVTVSSTSVAGTVSANQAICSGSLPSDIILTGSNGAIQWQSSTDNITFNNISGAIAPTLTNVQIGALTGTRYYKAVVTNGGCVAVTSATVTISIGSTTTWNGNAWSNGTPTSASAVVFTANYTSVGDINACTVNVSNNANVIISTGNNITINGALTVDSGSHFTLKTNANLLQNTNVANIGSIVVERVTSALMRQDYVMWSPPVNGQQLQSFSPETLATRYYTYNPSTNLYAVVASPSNTNFETGTGYLIRMPNNHPATPTTWLGAFTGTPHNGDFNVPVTNGGYNAIGNPYPSAIDADDFIAANGITEALYFWRKTNNTVTTSYATYTTAGGTSNSGSDPLGLTPNGIIDPCQGFIIKATSPSVSFTNAMRSNNTTSPFFRLIGDRSRIWLNLTSPEGFFGQTLLAYMPTATSGVDPAIDGRFFNDSPTALTSLIDNQEYAIQGRATFDSNDIVLLGFKSQLGGNYTIAINNVDGLFGSASQSIYLKDNLNNTINDLKISPYTFASEAGVFNSRFELVYENLLMVGQHLFSNNSVVIYHQNEMLVVNSGKVNMKKVQLYDLRGRLVVEKTDINATEVKFNIGNTNQVLIAKVTSDTNETVIKKIVN